jgi:hypothetical protein
MACIIRRWSSSRASGSDSSRCRPRRTTRTRTRTGATGCRRRCRRGRWAGKPAPAPSTCPPPWATGACCPRTPARTAASQQERQRPDLACRCCIALFSAGGARNSDPASALPAPPQRPHGRRGEFRQPGSRSPPPLIGARPEPQPAGRSARPGGARPPRVLATARADGAALGAGAAGAAGAAAVRAGAVA